MTVNEGILVLDLLNKRFVTSCSLILLVGDYGRFQAACFFGLILLCIEHCNLVFGDEE